MLRASEYIGQFVVGTDTPEVKLRMTDLTDWVDLPFPAVLKLIYGIFGGHPLYFMLGGHAVDDSLPVLKHEVHTFTTMYCPSEAVQYHIEHAAFNHQLKRWLLTTGRGWLFDGETFSDIGLSRLHHCLTVDAGWFILRYRYISPEEYYTDLIFFDGTEAKVLGTFPTVYPVECAWLPKAFGLFLARQLIPEIMRVFKFWPDGSYIEVTPPPGLVKWGPICANYAKGHMALIAVTTEPRVFTFDGEKFTDHGNPIGPGKNLYSLAVSPDGRVLIGGDDGVLMSTEDYVTWKEHTANLGWGAKYRVEKITFV